jgi:hypothetical protein
MQKIFDKKTLLFEKACCMGDLDGVKKLFVINTSKISDTICIATKMGHKNIIDYFILTLPPLYNTLFLVSLEIAITLEYK